eukprot:CAMPEP_0195056170 /NCGR_PEP_ID=MMETSP0448-20130528/4689_1 /TAXON_ID=66468 /ORGANISM="Heterocapsa triquestra, Strain CCMP 448" /LENGTH=103 /DNA_ID=CAMNT_0040085969 /DNA_START=21 /DNA_END=332 /DNA_ORIENTATION=+
MIMSGSISPVPAHGREVILKADSSYDSIAEKFNRTVPVWLQGIGCIIGAGVLFVALVSVARLAPGRHLCQARLLNRPYAELEDAMRVLRLVDSANGAEGPDAI